MADTSVAVTPGLGAPIAVEVQNALDYQVILPGAKLTTPYTEVAINIAGAGDNQIVAAVAAKQTRLYGFFLMATGGAVNVKWKDGAVDFHPALSLLGIGATWMLPRDGNAWFTGTANTALFLNLSAAIQVSGRAYYINI